MANQLNAICAGKMQLNHAVHTVLNLQDYTIDGQLHESQVKVNI